jgi:hypothetical protein
LAECRDRESETDNGPRIVQLPSLLDDDDNDDDNSNNKEAR